MRSISILFAFLLFAGTLSAQGESKSWPASGRVSFISECVNAAKAGMSEDSARFYCYCMLEKLEKKYTIEELDKLPDSIMQSPQMKREVNACLGGTWKPSERQAFMTNCIGASKENLGETKAKNYCECMLFKVEQRYPVEADSREITAELLATPEWKAIIRNCLNF